MKRLINFMVVLSGISLLYYAGCAAAPDKSEIEQTIIKHFQAKNYRVIDLKIGDISSVPISRETYMGTPGYMIDVPSLTLQPVDAKGIDRNEKMVTFSNAHILIQRGRGPHKKWIITNITGINAP